MNFYFFVFFGDFGFLESLILVLPPAREHDFYKIIIFHFISNFGPKIVVFRIQNPYTPAQFLLDGFSLFSLEGDNCRIQSNTVAHLNLPSQ